jgi:ABC-type phosphate/phosphonate transport system substrate-binding protein
VLRVFFRQSDACLVTADAFELACELNPQLRRDLKVLVASPPLIPTLLFFRRGCTGPARAEVEAAILDLHSTPAGQQVLTVFQGSRIERHPLSCLDATQALFSEYHRLPAPLAQSGVSASTAGARTAKAP